MKISWIPEHPSLPLYRAREPSHSGKLGEVMNLLTSDANEALQFQTKEECESWISQHPRPVFKAVEHAFMKLTAT